jgi:hypothetical protein
MPYPNEHAARQKDPGKYDDFRRAKWPGSTVGVSVIYGIYGKGENRKAEIQSLRFNAKKFTPEQAKKWLKSHNFSTSKFEKASGESKPVTKTIIKENLWQGIL